MCTESTASTAWNNYVVQLLKEIIGIFLFIYLGDPQSKTFKTGHYRGFTLYNKIEIWTRYFMEEWKKRMQP